PLLVSRLLARLLRQQGRERRHRACSFEPGRRPREERRGPPDVVERLLEEQDVSMCLDIPRDELLYERVPPQGLRQRHGFFVQAFHQSVILHVEPPRIEIKPPRPRWPRRTAASGAPPRAAWSTCEIARRRWVARRTAPPSSRTGAECPGGGSL